MRRQRHSDPSMSAKKSTGGGRGGQNILSRRVWSVVTGPSLSLSLKATRIAFPRRLFLGPPYHVTPHKSRWGWAASGLDSPTCDLLYKNVYATHFSTPGLHPPPPPPPHPSSLSLSLLDFSSSHYSLEAGFFLLEGIASWLIHNQAVTLRPTPRWLIMEKKNKQNHRDTRGVITRSETVFGKFFFLKQVHTCTARSIFSFVCFFY